MPDDLILKKNTPSTPTTSFAQPISQQGQKNTLIQHASTVIINTTPVTIPIISPNHPITPGTNYYNLIVSNAITLSTTNADIKFSIEPERALTEYIDAEEKKQFALLTDDAIRKLETFPTIFANENTKYGSTDPEQLAGFGYITKIKVRHEGIIIKPSILLLFHQQILNENHLDFDIQGHTGFNELNRTHWTVKKVDLISEFREQGFEI